MEGLLVYGDSNLSKTNTLGDLVWELCLKDEVLNVIRRLDLTGDRRITLDEFSEALLPTKLTVNRHPHRR